MTEHLPAILALTVIAAAIIATGDRPPRARRATTDDTPATGPACPHCGGGPVVPILGGATACKSCARVITPGRPT